MARRLPPWHWLRVLRAEGPRDPNVHLLLYVLSTYMNRDGECWPSQSAIVQATRLCRATVQRCIETARLGEWIAVQPGQKVGQGWRLSHYTACVPDRIELEEFNFEPIADTWASQFGAADDSLHGQTSGRRAAAIAAPRAQGGPTIRPRNTASKAEGGLNDPANVAQPLTEGGLNRGQKVAQPLDRKSSSKSSRSLHSEEGHALTRETDRVKDAHEGKPEPGTRRPEPGIQANKAAAKRNGSDLRHIAAEVFQGRTKPEPPKRRALTAEAGAKFVIELHRQDGDIEAAIEHARRIGYPIDPDAIRAQLGGQAA